MKRAVLKSGFYLGIFLFLQFGILLNAQDQQNLQGHVPKVVKKLGLQPVSRLNSKKQMKLVIGLPLRNREELNNLFQELYNPKSPTFRRYLTTDQFTSKFGPTEQDYQALIDFVKANGLTVTATSPNRVLLNVNGSVADIEKAFHINMQVYQHPTEHRTFFAPDAEPTVPSSLSVVDIAGLNNYGSLRTHQSTSLKKPPTNHPNGSGPSGTYMGNDFRAAYAPGVTLTGTGQTVGIVSFCPFDTSDIGTFYRQILHAPSYLQPYTVLMPGCDGLYHNNSLSWEEITEDIQMAVSMAPAINVRVYEAAQDSDELPSQWHTIFNSMATYQPLAQQLSCSFYNTAVSDFDSVSDGIFIEMAIQGQSFFNASGDGGAYTNNPNGIVYFPDGSPYITQVGGTSLYTNNPGGTWQSEIVWNDHTNGSYDDMGVSGGGISTNYLIPSYQQGMSTSNGASSTHRNIPDVAMVADSICIYWMGSNHPNCGGTSASAPLWAGFTALINQQAIANGKPTVGFLNPVLYLIGNSYPSKYATDFHDITIGNNNGIGTNGYNACTGYDLCTGWGTPAGQSLINDIISLDNYPAYVDQYLKNGTTAVDSVARWESSTFHKYPAHTSLTFYLGNDPVLRGTQKTISRQKYNNWNGKPDVTNHHIFSNQILTHSFQSNLDSMYNATLQVNVDGAILGSVGFKDPWLIDYPDPIFGNNKRNQGMSALFYSIPYAQYNIGISSNNSGVFLGLDPAHGAANYYTISASQSVSVGGTNHGLYFNNWTSSGATLANSTADTTAVVFTSNNATVTANGKGSLLSNNASTFANNSQRKIVRTGNGWLHQVYESMGHVWYEVSTDNGNTWSLMSPGYVLINYIMYPGAPGPLDSAGAGGKCPSIDYCHFACGDTNSIIIVFQQNSGGYSTIRQIAYHFYSPPDGGPWVEDVNDSVYIGTYGGDSYASTNINPTITWGSDNSGLLTWEKKNSNNHAAGIYYLAGQINPKNPNNCQPEQPGFVYSMTPALITGTTSLSTNATSTYVVGNLAFYTAWEQDVNSTSSSIKLDSLPANGTQGSLTPKTLSNSSFSKNYKPSIIATDTMVLCSWIGDVDGTGTWMNVSTLERNIFYPTIYKYGAGVQSVSINKDNGSNYYFAYSQNTSGGWWTNWITGSNLGLKTLNTTGQNIQLSNGATSANMLVSSFYNTSALPYYFQLSNTLTSAPQGDVIAQTNAASKAKSVSKSNAVYTTSAVASGRGRGAAVGGFYYSVGNLNVDGNLIDFVSANSKANYDKLDTLNNALLSQPFTINSNSVLSFSENSGAADSMAATIVLGSQGYLTFTVQLIDNASGSVLGTVRQLKFSSANLQKYKTSPFTLPITGLGGKTGILKITVGTNLSNLQSALVEQYAGPAVSVMGQAITLAMQPTSAAGVTLGSYPNPFNPSTNIRYQLIENSRVSIKVYDILGRQITTLVDGNKSAGQYIAVFDGSHYASGVYFVRMMVQGSNSQQVVKTLKIQMLK